MLAIVLLASGVVLAAPHAGQLRNEVLRAPRVIAGVPCADYVRYERDRLRACRLGRDVELRAGVIPAGSPVFLDERGIIVRTFLSRATVLQGHACRGGPAKWETEFHPSGALARCWLNREETIDGIHCDAGGIIADLRSGDSSATFREDGRLEACLLSADAWIGGTLHRRGTRAGPR